MNINRHNYEEYFILYMDNELNREDKNLVELFVQQNPDLEEELVMLQQSKLVADTTVTFGDKENLMRSADDMIDLTNYEEWLLLYNDNELTTDQKRVVEKFITLHPEAKAELALLQKAKFQPEENILFTNKESLYRREEKVRVISIRWWRIAAAAVILFAVSITAFNLLSGKKDETGIASEKNNKTETAVQNNSSVTKTGDQIKEENRQVADESNIATEKTAPANDPVVTKKSNEIKKESLPATIKQEEFTAKKDEKNKNDLPQPTYNPNMLQKNMEKNDALAVNDIISKETLTNLKGNNKPVIVTPDITQPSYTSNTSTETNDEIVDAEQPEKKNKLRGFFRRVTRTFEKRTNIKATDEEDRLLIGGLAIKL